jgi:hypothetical protein
MEVWKNGKIDSCFVRKNYTVLCPEFLTNPVHGYVISDTYTSRARHVYEDIGGRRFCALKRPTEMEAGAPTDEGLLLRRPLTSRVYKD